MKVHSVTPERLELVWRPWVLATGLAVLTLCMTLITLVWLGAGEFAAAAKSGLGLVIAAGGFAAFTRREVVIFDRKANAVVLRSVSLVGARETTRSLADATGAHPCRNPSSMARRNPVWRPQLMFAGGDQVPLSAVFISGNSAKVCCDAVNAWLTQGHTSPPPA